MSAEEEERALKHAQRAVDEAFAEAHIRDDHKADIWFWLYLAIVNAAIVLVILAVNGVL